MASSVLYPPTINDSAPAFVYGAESKCKIYFSLSKFNSREDFTSVHLAIYDQKTGLSVVNKENKNKTAVTGIIIDIADNLIHSEEDVFDLKADLRFKLIIYLRKYPIKYLNYVR